MEGHRQRPVTLGTTPRRVVRPRASATDQMTHQKRADSCSHAWRLSEQMPNGWRRCDGLKHLDSDPPSHQRPVSAAS